MCNLYTYRVMREEMAWLIAHSPRLLADPGVDDARASLGLGRLPRSERSRRGPASCRETT